MAGEGLFDHEGEVAEVVESAGDSPDDTGLVVRGSLQSDSISSSFVVR